MRILIDNTNKKLDKITLVIKKKNEPIFKDISNNVALAKAKIDKLNDIKQWDKIKKLTNPYEMIYNSNNWNKKSNSISKYLAMSRSFYKLWEMMFDYDLLHDFINTPIVSANLAEGPGGFIEAIIKYRESNKHFKDDKIFGITLKPTSKFIPGWEKMKGDLYKNTNTLYGSLYDAKIVKIYSNIVNKAHIVTADGGFDYSVDFNKQEQLSYHLIFAEIITALHVQKIGGHFVCKVFDIFDTFSLKCIYLLTYFYKDVNLVKISTSRLCSSEKYVIAKNFIGISDENRDNLLQCLKDYKDLEDLSLNCINCVDLNGLNMDKSFIEQIRSYNISYCNNQINCINKTLDIIHFKLNKKEYNNIVSSQIKNAVDWCEKYHVEH